MNQYSKTNRKKRKQCRVPKVMNVDEELKKKKIKTNIINDVHSYIKLLSV